MQGTLTIDSGSLISLSTSCLFDIIKELSNLGIRFVVSTSVVEESVSYPLKVKRFELNALRISRGISDGWLHTMKLDESSLAMKKQIMEHANRSYYSKHGPITILQEGEAEIMALAYVLNANGIVTDERTMRMLIEDPYGLKDLLQMRRGEKIKINPEVAEFFRKKFKDIVVVRSAELIALSYEKGILQKIVGDVPNLLEGALYSLKYAGCSLSSEEIERFLRH